MAKWYEKFIEERERLKDNIILAFHCVVEKMPPLNLSAIDVKKIIMTGKVIQDKCEKPNKIVFARYYGKELNTTYVVVTRFNPNNIKVITLWAVKGRL